MSFLLGLHRALFARRRLYRLNRLIYLLALRGMGILNYESPRSSGEGLFLKNFCRQRPGALVLDVGANKGSYSESIKGLDGTARIIAFEPHPITFGSLAALARKLQFTALNLGVGERQGMLKLYDYEENDGSQHASLYQSVIEDIHGARSKQYTIPVTTLDEFAREHSIGPIGLLKIDTEGHELSILRGAKEVIEAGMVEVIHFEFNEMNVVSRAFMRDFWDELPMYRFYRMLPDGLLELKEYSPLMNEIFAYQNIVAIDRRSSLHSWL